MASVSSLYDFEVTTIDGRSETLATYRGRTLLIVNVASECGFTRQYAELESLYRRHRHAGFSVLGFPCDQFGHQEPGNEAEIQRFCREQYDVTFPLFAKIEVNGPSAHPLYRHLKTAKQGLLGGGIKWNFTKFLVAEDGEVLQRYAPMTAPKSIEKDVVPLLA